MKFLSNPKNLPVFSAGAGLMALVLRSLLFLLGRDEKNLLIPGHPLDLLVWSVTAAVAAVTLASVWKLAGSSGYADNFAPSAAETHSTLVLSFSIPRKLSIEKSSAILLLV